MNVFENPWMCKQKRTELSLTQLLHTETYSLSAVYEPKNNMQDQQM